MSDCYCIVICGRGRLLKRGEEVGFKTLNIKGCNYREDQFNLGGAWLMLGWEVVVKGTLEEGSVEVEGLQGHYTDHVPESLMYILM